MALRYPIIYVVVQVVMFLIVGVAVSFGGGSETAIDAAVMSNTLLVMLMSAVVTFFIIWLLQRKEWKSEKFWKFSGISGGVVIICAVAGLFLNVFTSIAIYLTQLTTGDNTYYI